MGHGLTTQDSLLLVGKPAWHKLGNVIPESIPVEDAFQQTLPWEVEKVPLQAIVHGDDPQRMRVVDVPNHFATMRVPDDPDEECIPLGVVGKDYNLVQNARMAQVAKAAEDVGYRLETIGSVAQGRGVFFLLKVGEYGIAHRAYQGFASNSGDRIMQYLAIMDRRDGTRACSVHPTEIRVVCQNTETASFKRAEQKAMGLRIPHTGETEALLKVVETSIREGTISLEKTKEETQALVRRSVGREDAAKVFDSVAAHVWPKAFKDYTKKEMDAWTEQERVDFQRARANARSAFELWTEEFEHERQAAVSGTAFAALSAITHWADHSRKRVRDGVQDKLFGKGAEIKQVARAAALELVS